MKSFTRKLIKNAKKQFPGKKIKLKKQFNINFELEFSGGLNNANNSSDNVLFRPYRVLTGKCRNVGRINHIIYQDKNTNKHYVMGSFCYTYYASKTKRLIFFPGLTGRKVLWHSKQPNPQLKGHIDHFTIEPDFKSWHYTSLVNGKKENFWLPDNKIFKITRGVYYWFGLSVNKIDVFEPLYKKYALNFHVHPNKIDKCYRVLMASKKKARDNIVLQPRQEATNHEFIHFDFLIDRRLFRRYRKFPIKISAVPFGRVMPKSSEVETKNYPIRRHSVNITSYFGNVIILVSKHKGKLPEDIIIGGKS